MATIVEDLPENVLFFASSWSSLHKNLLPSVLKSCSPVVTCLPHWEHVKHLLWYTLSFIFWTKSFAFSKESQPEQRVPNNLQKKIYLKTFSGHNC